jgi:type I restriction enzyme M protein
VAARRDEMAIAEAEAKLAELTREARDLANRAKEIEDAVYDLKAVNPHRKPDVDTRTPEELIAFIEAKGREIAEALRGLQGG